MIGFAGRVTAALVITVSAALPWTNTASAAQLRAPASGDEALASLARNDLSGQAADRPAQQAPGEACREATLFALVQILQTLVFGLHQNNGEDMSELNNSIEDVQNCGPSGENADGESDGGPPFAIPGGGGPPFDIPIGGPQGGSEDEGAGGPPFAIPGGGGPPGGIPFGGPQGEAEDEGAGGPPFAIPGGGGPPGGFPGRP